MGKTARFLYEKLKALSPETRDIIAGAGLAFDPLPESRYQTAVRSDIQAMRADWDAVGADLWWAVERAETECGRRQRDGE